MCEHKHPNTRTHTHIPVRDRKGIIEHVSTLGEAPPSCVVCAGSASQGSVSTADVPSGLSVILWPCGVVCVPHLVNTACLHLTSLTPLITPSDDLFQPSVS